VDAFLMPIRMAKFDKAVGELLLNADVAVTVPALADMFGEQVRATAENLGIPSDQAQLRSLHLAAAVLSSFLCSALTDGPKMGGRRVDAMLRKGMYMCAHPMLQVLQNQHAEQIPQLAVQMTVARVGRSAVVDLIRVLELCRQRALGQPRPPTQESPMSGMCSSEHLVHAISITLSRAGSTDWGSEPRAPATALDSPSAREYGAFLMSLQTLLLAAFSVPPRKLA
jgi:hypothetical protein